MSLKSLQEKIGVTADGAFGPGTIKAAAKHYGLSPERAAHFFGCLLYTSPSPRDRQKSRMPSSA